MLARMFRRLFENEGAGPKLREDVVPWSGVPWENGPLATPGRAGFAPAGGLPGQVLGVSADGLGYGWGGAPASVIVGKIDLLPFRVADLAVCAPGWHFCNGDLYPLESVVGAALNALPENFKADWGIVVSGENISIPNMFHTDGRGYFLRAANGATSKTASTADDTMRRITGSFSGLRFFGSASAISSGALYQGVSNSMDQPGATTAAPNQAFAIDTARLGVNYAGTETAPLARFMTPAIFLGV